MPPARASRKRVCTEESLAPTPTKRVREQNGRGRGRGRAGRNTSTTAKEATLSKAVIPLKESLFDALDGVAVSSSPTKAQEERQHLQDLDDDDSSLTSLTDQESEDVPLQGNTRNKANLDDDTKFKDVVAPTPAKRVRGQNKPGRGRGRGARNTTTGVKRATLNKAVVPLKATLFDALDGVVVSPSSAKGHEERQHLQGLDDDDDSSLTSLTDQEFEDVPLQGNARTEADSDDSDEDIEFEDVTTATPTPFPLGSLADDENRAASGDLELTLHKDTRVSLTNPYGEKKGPSKIERLVRNATHCMHVQALLWHNARRNAWLCDAEVQGILLSHLSAPLWDEVDRFRRASGLEKQPMKEAKATKTAKGKKGTMTKGTGKQTASPAKVLQESTVNLSHGDPLFRLIRALSAWWRQKFRVTAPGLRKIGYVSLERLDRQLKAFGETGGLDAARFGELIPSLAVFRVRAQKLCGSRDVGAQLFTALLRGLGLDTRMVASLQPLGFGWGKMEDADAEEEAAADGAVGLATEASVPTTPKNESRSKPNAVITINSDSGSDSDSDMELAEVNSDNDSAVVVPALDTRRRAVYDQDLSFPHYWTEVLSPTLQRYLSVDTLVKHVMATTREQVESLEPRGAKADRARQVLAYVVGYAADGTAKDVTVRYLKRQMLPGRTRGVRFPVEKVPVYDKRGKVRRYDQVDWFRLVMRNYVRGQRRENPITEVDEAEDASDLRPAREEKRPVKEGEETLQYYKQSSEFVLARHLKREEALVAGAEAVRTFRNKGKKGAVTESEDVYLRTDVVAVKSAETWHKQGRAPRAGEVPLKHVPYRAATINRKREIAEAEAATGERVLQGLYSQEQTEWIIPPPIQDGVIPKNAYGNIDLFVEHMCPQGAVHVPFRGAARVCRRLAVDYAEAVVDFEFGHRMAVPVIQGVVVAEEQRDRVLAALEEDEAARRRREDEKRRAAALAQWRKMLMGLRIVERIRQDYGEVEEGDRGTGGIGRVFGSGRHELDLAKETEADGEEEGADTDPDMAGGFLLEDSEARTSSFFPVDDDDDDNEHEDEGEGVAVE